MVSDVQKLREATGAGVMDCKKALQESDGDFDKAIEAIKKRGVAKAEKKASREASAGIIESYVHGGRVGVLLELHCETDFVAKNEVFVDLAHNIAMQIAAMDPENKEALLEQPYVKDQSQTIEALITGAISKLGENIKVGRFARFEI